jgi:hypothetical protein
LPHGWLASAWYEIVGSGDEKHLRAGTEVRRVRRFRSVIAYASKYLAKEQGPDEARADGRMWGIVGRQHLPIEIVSVEISARVWYSVRRQLRAYVERRTGKPWWSARGRRGGLTCYFPARSALKLLAFECWRLG